MNNQYTNIADMYDILNEDVDYSELADFLSAKTEAYYTKKPELVLDLACGTGKLTREFARRGYDMTGIDISEDMLAIASENSAKEKLDILYLCQDMTEFELYGTVDAVYCCFDSLNYLTKPTALKKCFSLVHNYLFPNGIFIFDMNTPYKFENTYAFNSYILENDGVFCAWQNYYNRKTKMCDFYLTFFKELEDGTYKRSDEVQRERCYSEKSVLKYLNNAGFELLEILGEDKKSKPCETDERRYYIVRAIK